MPFHEGAPVAFIQTIEIATTHPEQIQGLMDERVAKTEGRRLITQRPMVMPGSSHNRGT